ncbi:hypothetical protein [Mucilaginibacter sp.]|uniref:hypothetical protein n=1 Tax=Mucilaginibacter sp. TaxID=1882438 RepID=UPI002637DD8C|nr:hypothetical protein [Mucilaginibacter sp.]MDB4922197.1 hypothetical protein [Mucilaginibacter sp.]
MTTLTVKIPDGKATDVSQYIQNIGGEVVKSKKAAAEIDEDDEVTHEQYFGENIKRLIKAFSK